MISEDKVEDIYKLVNSWLVKNKLFTKDRLQDYVEDAWFEAVKNYDERRGKLSTFVYLYCMKFRSDEVRKMNAMKRSGIVLSIDEVDCLNQIESCFETPYESMMKYKDHLIFEECSKLLKDYFRGARQKDLANEYHVSQARISSRIREELEMLRKKVI